MKRQKIKNSQETCRPYKISCACYIAALKGEVSMLMIDSMIPAKFGDHRNHLVGNNLNHMHLFFQISRAHEFFCHKIRSHGGDAGPCLKGRSFRKYKFSMLLLFDGDAFVGLGLSACAPKRIKIEYAVRWFGSMHLHFEQKKLATWREKKIVAFI